MSAASNGRTLGYSFTPLPERVVQALARGLLSHVELAILAVLYERADFGRLRLRLPTPTMRLRHLAAAVGWTHTEDALARRLIRLRDREERWLTWTVDDGRGRRTFTLYPDALDLSDLCPTSQPETRPTSENRAERIDSAVAAPAAGAVSDHEKAPDGGNCPTSPVPCPTLIHSETRMDAGDMAATVNEPVRPPQTSQKHQTLSPKEELELATREKQAPPQRSASDSPSALLHEAERVAVNAARAWSDEAHPGDALAAEIAAVFPSVSVVDLSDDNDWRTVIDGRFGTVSYSVPSVEDVAYDVDGLDGRLDTPVESEVQ
jgi:hypothetical protein